LTAGAVEASFDMAGLTPDAFRDGFGFKISSEIPLASVAGVLQRTWNSTWQGFPGATAWRTRRALTRDDLLH
jgi:hypothetical protein